MLVARSAGSGDCPTADFYLGQSKDMSEAESLLQSKIAVAIVWQHLAFGVGRSAIFDRPHAAEIRVSYQGDCAQRTGSFCPSVQARSFGTRFDFRLDSRRYQEQCQGLNAIVPEATTAIRWRV
jgi:hypothetical protein